MKSKAARFEHARAMAVGVDSQPLASVSIQTIYRVKTSAFKALNCWNYSTVIINIIIFLFISVVKCNDPGTPVNGMRIVSKGLVYGGSLRFKCNRDYTLMKGMSEIIYCQANKRWTASVPQCLGNGHDLVTIVAFFQEQTHLPTDRHALFVNCLLYTSPSPRDA